MFYSEAELKNNQKNSQPADKERIPSGDCQNAALFHQLSVKDKKLEGPDESKMKADPSSQNSREKVNTDSAIDPGSSQRYLYGGSSKDKPSTSAGLPGDVSVGNNMDTSMKRVDPDSEEFEKAQIDDYVA